MRRANRWFCVKLLRWMDAMNIGVNGCCSIVPSSASPYQYSCHVIEPKGDHVRSARASARDLTRVKVRRREIGCGHDGSGKAHGDQRDEPGVLERRNVPEKAQG